MYFQPTGDSGKKAPLTSIGAGVLFGAAWWFFIGATSYCHEVRGDDTTKGAEKKCNCLGAAGYSWIPGLVSTVAFVMINGMDWNELQGESSGLPGADSASSSKAKMFLCSAIVLGVIALAAGIFIFSSVFDGGDSGCKIAGVSVIVQTLLIFAGAILMRWGTIEN